MAFPRGSLEAGQRLIVFASGDDQAVDGNPLHTNFRLAENGEYLALSTIQNAVAETVFEYAPQYSGQLENISYGIGADVDPLALVGAPGDWQVSRSCWADFSRVNRIARTV